MITVVPRPRSGRLLCTTMMIVLVATIANFGPFETTSQAQAAGGLVVALALDEG